ncbi:MAG: NADP-dependent oxidoreductase [Flavobacteriaceae bacterium]
MTQIKSILLDKRPIGLPKLSDFSTVKEEVPEVAEGNILLKLKYASVDPYLRGRMNDVKSYIPPFELGRPIVSGGVAEVLDSRHADFKQGDFVSGMMAWKEIQTSKGEGLYKVDPNLAPLSAYLGVLGLTGLTAYLGLTEIGKPKKGETLVVSGAAGAVGSIVGQLGKLLGLKVIGTAGSDEKVAMLTDKFGFDKGINYNTTENMVDALKTACPDGIDIYWDNVGGKVSEAVLFNINKFARLIQCGAISIYNETQPSTSIPVHTFLIRKSALMQGFIVFDYEAKYPEAIKALSEWLRAGKLNHAETIREGFEALPQAFIDLFHGKNVGKMLVQM